MTNEIFKKKLFLIILTCVLLGFATIFLYFLWNKRVKEDSTDVANCINYQDAEQFEEPIPIIWTAKFDGNCLSSCWGASFTKVPEDSKYPRFSGYVSDDGERIADEYLKEDQILKIYGNWVDVSDSYGSVFDNKCVPTVEIEKIEIVSKV